MAKTAVGQWDTTAANNTDINSIGIQGTNLVSNFDNALRELMSQVRTFQTSGYFGSATAAMSFGVNTNALQVVGVGATSAATGRIGVAMFSATANVGPGLDFYRSKDAAINTATVVASGDRLASINFYGAQQTGTLSTQSPAAQIKVEVDGTVTSGASGDMPGRFIFATSPDGSATVVDRLTIDSTGLVTLSAGQIAFPASQNVSAGANTFDDFERGTWTPTLLTDNVQFSAITYDAAVTGKYNKFASTVIVSGYMETDSITVGAASGSLLIGGFPFTSLTSSPQGCMALGISAAWNSQAPFFMPMKSNSTTALLYKRIVVTGDATMSNVGFAGANTGANSNLLAFGGSYFNA